MDKVQASSLIRTYTSHDAYQQDATRLARLGYVVASVVEARTVAMGTASPEVVWFGVQTLDRDL
jgi:hypothetical protein